MEATLTAQLTILVLAHVEPPEKHDGLLAQVPAHRLDCGVGIEHFAGGFSRATLTDTMSTTIPTTIRLGPRPRGRLYSPRANIQHAPTATKPIIPGTIDDPANTDLAQRGRAHDARLDSDVQRDSRERRGVVREEVVDGFEFGVQCCL